MQSTFRPPAVPLVVHDPYFSVWSFNDRLTDGWTKHWTGSTMAMVGYLRIDGKAYQFCGNGSNGVPAMEQTSLVVRATTTEYQFSAGGVKLQVEFQSPTIPTDLELLSKPVCFVRLKYSPTDGKSHQVEAYFDVTGEWVVDRPDQRVTWGRVRVGGREALRIGSQDQAVLAKRGDDLRIDWGHLYLVPPAGGSCAANSDQSCRRTFATSGELPESDDLRMPRPANDAWPVLSTAFNLVANEPKSVLLAYDDLQSLEWFKRPVPAYWRRNGESFQSMLSDAAAKESAWAKLATDWDERVDREAIEFGGKEFRDLAALSFRQAFAAHKIVADIDGEPMMLSKENFSNGCIGTVDVLYPAAPIMLAYNPQLLEANMRPLMIYSRLPRWKWPFAPHDLGQYPHANGQVYGGAEVSEENQMPVEECGNMLILAAALVHAGGSTSFVQDHLPTFDKWADYLLAHGLDPANQLCTDDFAGHLARNANLSLKAIVGLGAYAKMLDAMKSHPARARQIHEASKKMATEWQRLANDGDHYRLAYDREGSWSQKYNLIWDKVLSLNLFPNAVYRKELDFYSGKLNRFGLPLDSRRGYTKLDWCIWTACLSDRKAEQMAHISPLWRMANESPSRVPLTDWFETENARQVGFQARSVVGGVFMPMLLQQKRTH
jgi:hypothetical protein